MEPSSHLANDSVHSATIDLLQCLINYNVKWKLQRFRDAKIYIKWKSFKTK